MGLPRVDISDEPGLVRDYLDGMLQAAIMKKYGVSVTRLYKILDKFGVKPNRYKCAREVRQAIIGKDLDCVCGVCGQPFASYEIEFQMFTHTCRNCLAELDGGMDDDT